MEIHLRTVQQAQIIIDSPPLVGVVRVYVCVWYSAIMMQLTLHFGLIL